MVRIIFSAALLFAASVFAAPATPDPSGDKNIGNAAGLQFIGGECLSSKDCAATACCAFNNNGRGICSGLGAQTQAGKTGCGFGDGGASSAVSSSAASVATGPAAAPAAAPATGSTAVTIDTSAPGAANVGTGNGQQFITGQCLSDADCASACCANPKGVCSAVAVASDSGKQGCGFVGTAA
ncbi:putative Biotrophy-associated secreted protein 2 [Seiridium cardinale]|uniref:Biotrophy-associated secreted protein 2 n=1 Tax=Seiridium cardinale TaxID=138064 RepID=A0ABR2Y8V6_9PEZI